jgi:hypothetical protein
MVSYYVCRTYMYTIYLAYTYVQCYNIQEYGIMITPTYFAVNTPSSGSLQVVLAKVMNYYNDKIQYIYLHLVPTSATHTFT